MMNGTTARIWNSIGLDRDKQMIYAAYIQKHKYVARKL